MYINKLYAVSAIDSIFCDFENQDDGCPLQNSEYDSEEWYYDNGYDHTMEDTNSGDIHLS